jgi:hypothetical protein
MMKTIFGLDDGGAAVSSEPANAAINA